MNSVQRQSPVLSSHQVLHAIGSPLPSETDTKITRIAEEAIPLKIESKKNLSQVKATSGQGFWKTITEAIGKLAIDAGLKDVILPSATRIPESDAPELRQKQGRLENRIKFLRNENLFLQLLEQVNYSTSKLKELIKSHEEAIQERQKDPNSNQELGSTQDIKESLETHQMAYKQIQIMELQNSLPIQIEDLRKAKIQLSNTDQLIRGGQDSLVDADALSKKKKSLETKISSMEEQIERDKGELKKLGPLKGVMKEHADLCKEKLEVDQKLASIDGCRYIDDEDWEKKEEGLFDFRSELMFRSTHGKIFSDISLSDISLEVSSTGEATPISRDTGAIIWRNARDKKAYDEWKEEYNDWNENNQRGDPPPSPQFLNKNFIFYLNGNAEFYEESLEGQQKYGEKADANILVFNYRGVNKSKGKVNEANDLINGAKAFYDFLRSMNVPQHRIYLHARSIGGGIGAALANLVDAKGIVIERSYSSISGVVAGMVEKIGQTKFGGKLKALAQAVASLIIKPFSHDVLKSVGWEIETAKELASLKAKARKKGEHVDIAFITAKNDHIMQKRGKAVSGYKREFKDYAKMDPTIKQKVRLAENWRNGSLKEELKQKTFPSQFKEMRELIDRVGTQDQELITEAKNCKKKLDAYLKGLKIDSEELTELRELQKTFDNFIQGFHFAKKYPEDNPSVKQYRMNERIKREEIKNFHYARGTHNSSLGSEREVFQDFIKYEKDYFRRAEELDKQASQNTASNLV